MKWAGLELFLAENGLCQKNQTTGPGNKIGLVISGMALRKSEWADLNNSGSFIDVVCIFVWSFYELYKSQSLVQSSKHWS